MICFLSVTPARPTEGNLELRCPNVQKDGFFMDEGVCRCCDRPKISFYYANNDSANSQAKEASWLVSL